MMPPGLIIFDCDGVLIDSEVMAVEVLTATLTESGCPMSPAEGYAHLLGRSSSHATDWLARERGFALTPAVKALNRDRLLARFDRDLAAMPGAAEVLATLPCQSCVASSSDPERLHHGLRVTGLWPLVEGRVFSAVEVARGKPAPDLNLHAAARMGVLPQRTWVIEDSPAGIMAAQAAGMRAIAFTGGAHMRPSGLADALAALGPDATISNLTDLAGLMGGA
ncbi:HAD family hydrolase [Wenxinia saemankumensis]|uniref:Haloacid dehalogenase superfamily, subfamily IA, variant 3 with third motif having DD or ED n=1 Tax=Wenxinia saemankumensis TaxID=1447782 RepID=A0A1M6EK24_9RHOB|nr:HAD family hydrolase [Wenxinia saemankumensis]SHI85862.1 haloacid dehalogenase superfamily, subfamily IA, variant 3 with third motif having DD or ED [Wenxinia saemankumensis]